MTHSASFDASDACATRQNSRFFTRTPLRTQCAHVISSPPHGAESMSLDKSNAGVARGSAAGFWGCGGRWFWRAHRGTLARALPGPAQALPPVSGPVSGAPWRIPFLDRNRAVSLIFKPDSPAGPGLRRPTPKRLAFSNKAENGLSLY